MRPAPPRCAPSTVCYSKRIGVHARTCSFHDICIFYYFRDTLVFTKMNEELLINLVQGYKELYDLQDPHYDDQQRRDNIWKEIGDIMKESATACRERWRRVRDNYRRAKKLRKTKSGQAATNMKKPKYEDLLSFLIPYISNEDETFSNFPLNNVSQDSSNEDNSLLDDNHSRDSPGSSAGTSQSTIRNRPGSSEDISPRPYKRNSKSLDTPPQLSPTHSLLQEYLEKKYRAQKNESHKIVDFFKNLGETVSNFPEDVQIRVKREVFKIVTDAEELVFRDKSKPQYVLKLSQESASPIIGVLNDLDAQPPNQIITPTSTNVNTNNNNTQEEIGLDLDDNALNVFFH
ncbi:uncharacterized protein LOC123704468 [Colias croceus]|uniref:uncharacterized protein LOC123691083 n=1 Tax=Colias crocea TaxID=72248 RepID=UPI001E28108A|nr:uncharacterized protein LOC123691083 [Colias croceus]XP_045494223.1 uncharacterized protein LOC123693262 [Colias croceus]XP_045496259.1 uncharacterized protein LOC123694749 [Colias croceus]XP_045508820.1 uncharacterized protein LOC123704468 [Colias croceus]